MSIESTGNSARRRRWHGLALAALFATFCPLASAAADESPASLQKSCDGGIASACTTLGTFYENGQNVSKDAPKAAMLYARACGPNEPRACLYLGVMYSLGNGIAMDPAKAAGLYAIACDARSAQACHNLAQLYGEGQGVPKDNAKSIVMLQSACAMGFADSCLQLGGKHYKGEGLPKDLSKALGYFDVGCVRNSGKSCLALAAMLNAGEGQAMDVALAAKAYRKACELGEQSACASHATAAATAPAAKVSAAASAAAKAAAAECRLVKVGLGVDTVANVERDIQARGGSPLTGGTGSVGKFRISAMDGDYADAGPGVMAVNYDFDAAGPNGRLIAVTISRNVAFNDYAKLAADRKAALTKVFGPLKAKSATEHSGSAAGCTLALHENPDGGWLYEIFRLPN